MRLIDADALTGRMKEFLCDPKKCDNYGGVRCRACSVDDAFDWIDSEPTADSIPIKPLAEWLAEYAFPPGLKARKIVNNRGRDIHEVAAEGWEEFLREMNWEEVNDDGGRTD